MTARAALLVTVLLGAACGDDDGGGDPDAGTGMDAGGGGGDAGDGTDAGGGVDAPPGDDARTPTDGETLDGGSGEGGPVSMPCMATGACDPFDAASCGAGMACRPGMTGTECGPVGGPDGGAPLAEDQTCTRTTDCAGGLLCLDFGDGAGFTCQRMCPNGAIGACGAGKACIGTIGDECIRVCRPVPPRCNIFTQDCPDATDACTLVRHPETDEAYTGCRAAGTQGRGEPCGGMSGSCARGLICIRDASGMTACRPVCGPDGSAPVCTEAGEACTGLARTWGVPYCQ
jgi:hypothetical protein